MRPLLKLSPQALSNKWLLPDAPTLRSGAPQSQALGELKLQGRQMRIARIPEDILWQLKVLFPIKQGECFSNSGVATICALGDYDYSQKVKNHQLLIRYALGFLSPPGYDTVPHAWLVCTKDNKVTFPWDATLQVNSPLWNRQSQDFRYETKHILTADELRNWLRKKYPDREFTTDGIPHGNCSFPIINQTGVIE